MKECEQLQLNVWERTMLTSVVSSHSPRSVGKLRQCLAVVEVLELSSEEKAEVGWQEIDINSARWDDVDRMFEIEFSAKHFERVQHVVREALKRGAFQTDPKVLTLLEKLEIAEEE